MERYSSLDTRINNRLTDFMGVRVITSAIETLHFLWEMQFFVFTKFHPSFDKEIVTCFLTFAMVTNINWAVLINEDVLP